MIFLLIWLLAWIVWSGYRAELLAVSAGAICVYLILQFGRFTGRLQA